MRKIIFVLAVLVFAAPTWAGVTVTATQIPDTNNVQLTYSQDANRPRAFALEISVTSNPGDFVTIAGVDPNNLGFDYYIYPGSIVITGGVVTDYGTPVAAQDANSMILEMGSLYAAEDTEHPAPPPASGDLCIIILEGCGSGILTIEENAERGGVVMEDPYESVEPTLTGCSVTLLETCEVWCDQFCYPGCNSPEPNTPDFDVWRDVNEPNCWCYPRQCHGDADGIKEGSKIAGYFYVGFGDLAIMLEGWKVKEVPKGPGLSGNQICADFAHDVEGSKIAGYFRVGFSDLAIMLEGWKVKEDPKGPGIPPDCGGTLEP